MIIELYMNKAEKNKIGKMPQELVKSLSGVLKEATNVTDPTFKVTTLTPEDISKINYAYVPAFNRYYFVNQITFVRNNLYELSCHVDVLESFKTDILNLNCRIARQSKEYNLLLPDNEVQLKQNNRVVIKNFNNNIDFTPTLVMITAGGYSSSYQSYYEFSISSYVIGQTETYYNFDYNGNIVSVNSVNTDLPAYEQVSRKVNIIVPNTPYYQKVTSENINNLGEPLGYIGG